MEAEVAAFKRGARRRPHPRYAQLSERIKGRREKVKALDAEGAGADHPGRRQLLAEIKETTRAEAPEYEPRIELMVVQTEHFRTQIKWEPWKAMAVAVGAGSGLTLAIIGIVTLLLRVTGHG